MNTLDLDACKQAFSAALEAGDLDRADEVLLQVPDAAREHFDAWIREQLPADALEPETDAKGLAAEFARRGASADDAAMIAALMTGSKPPAVLVAEAMEAKALDAEQVSDALVSELAVPADTFQARSRIARAIRNVLDGRDAQARRFAPDAVDALAKVLGGSVEAFRRAFEAAAAPQAGVAGAFAREGHDGLTLPDDLAAEDDDIVDELFYRSEL
jgi:hypothetical protein